MLKDQFEAPVAMLALSPDGSLLATIEDGLQVPHVWELPSGKARAVFEGHGDKVNSVAFSPDGKHVVSTSGDETIRIWEATAGHPRPAAARPRRPGVHWRYSRRTARRCCRRARATRRCGCGT